MKKVLLALGMMAAISPAMASTGSTYFGGSLGQATLNLGSDITSGIESAGGSIDNDDMGYKLFLGHRSNDHFAMEISYVDLGETKISSTNYNATIEADSLSLVGLGILPITSSFELFGKAGFHMWDSSLGDTIGNSASGDGTDLVYGLGLAYKIDTLSIRAEYENYTLDDADVDMVSLGVSISF